jgi:hypothetical protein
MALKFDIPKELAHLKIDERGYPVPYFVSWVDGKPEFRFLDHSRQEMIIEKGVCHICGKKLNKDYNYVISGPIGYQNRISSDAAMHRVCAEFSLKACPHLYLQKAERRENDELGKAVSALPSPVVKEKPSILLLVRISKYKTVKHGKATYLKYTPAFYETYHYVNNKLEKKES